MSEQNLSRRLSKKMNAHERVLVWERVENSVSAGMHDVYGETIRRPFWCELKHVHEYPARLSTPIRFKRYTPQQARTISRFGQSGKVGSWILIQVEDDHWLFDHTKAEALQVLQPLPWWEANAFEIWRRRLDYDQLASML